MCECVGARPPKLTWFNIGKRIFLDMHMNIFIEYLYAHGMLNYSINEIEFVCFCRPINYYDTCRWKMEKFVDELSGRFFRLIHFSPVNWVWSMPLHSTRWKLVCETGTHCGFGLVIAVASCYRWKFAIQQRCVYKMDTVFCLPFLNKHATVQMANSTISLWKANNFRLLGVLLPTQSQIFSFLHSH